jgi:hypothetical protein
MNIEWRPKESYDNRIELYIDGQYRGYVAKSTHNTKTPYYTVDDLMWSGALGLDYTSLKTAQAALIEHTQHPYMVKQYAKWGQIARGEAVPEEYREVQWWPADKPLYQLAIWNEKTTYYASWRDARKSVDNWFKDVKGGVSAHLYRRANGVWREIAHVRQSREVPIADYLLDWAVPKEFRLNSMRQTPIYELIQKVEEADKKFGHYTMGEVRAQYQRQPNDLPDDVKTAINIGVVVSTYVEDLLTDMKKGSPQGCRPFHAMTTKEVGTWLGITPEHVQEEIVKLDTDDLWALEENFLLMQWHPNYNHRRWICCGGSFLVHDLKRSIFERVLRKIAVRTRIKQLTDAGAKHKIPDKLDAVKTLKSLEGMRNDLDDEVLMHEEVLCGKTS